jgi:tRNA-2-methylthio-N6-dimethylallyladenosine synthase
MRGLIKITMRNVHIITYGCQMNEHDSEQMAGLLRAAGYSMTEHPENADVVLLNTCSIREKAEHKLYSRLGKLRALKQKNPEMIIGVCGCVAQQEKDRIFTQVSYVDLVLGTKAISRLPLLLDSLEYRPKALDIKEYAWDNDVPPVRECPFKAYITIMRGCDNFCAYCVVPYTRGREESRSSAEILHEARQLAEDGVVEVTLLGQNVSSYTDPTGEVASFPKLLEALHAVEGIKRLRFITAHPKDLSHELVATMAALPRVCEHFHLPCQAGSDNVLKLMNRCYTREWYLSRVEMLRNAMPRIAITTDIIVGFPGETEEDFQQTLSLLEEIRYDGIFAFKYSDRPNAKASTLPNHVPDEEKSERLQRVLHLQTQINYEKHTALVGEYVEVLPETVNPRFPDTLTGRTQTNHVITFPANANVLGQFVSVEITDAYPFRLAGKMI